MSAPCAANVAHAALPADDERDVMTDTVDMREELLDIIAKEGMVDREKLTGDATLETLGFASYDIVMILMAIEEKFGVYLSVDSELSDVKTLDDLLGVLTTRIADQQANPQPKPEDGAAPAVAPAADAPKADAPAPATKSETETT